MSNHKNRRGRGRPRTIKDQARRFLYSAYLDRDCPRLEWLDDAAELRPTYSPDGRKRVQWKKASTIRRQIETEARHVEVLTAYEVFGFLEPPGSAWRLEDRRAVRLFEDYAAYLGRQ